LGKRSFRLAASARSVIASVRSPIPTLSLQRSKYDRLPANAQTNVSESPDRQMLFPLSARFGEDRVEEA